MFRPTSMVFFFCVFCLFKIYPLTTPLLLQLLQSSPEPIEGGEGASPHKNPTQALGVSLLAFPAPQFHFSRNMPRQMMRDIYGHMN